MHISWTRAASPYRSEGIPYDYTSIFPTAGGSLLFFSIPFLEEALAGGKGKFKYLCGTTTTTKTGPAACTLALATPVKGKI